MRFGIQVMLKDEVLDTQGRALNELLVRQGEAVKNCRIGKYIVLDMSEESDEKQGIEKANKIAKELLHNPLIETFTITELP